MIQQLAHAEEVNEAPAAEDHIGVVLALVAGTGEDRLGEDEDHEGEQEPCLAVQECAEGYPGPNGVRDEGGDRVAHEFRVAVFGEPLRRLREPAVVADDEVPHVIVHAAEATFDDARTPHEAIEEHGQQRRRVGAEALDDVGVPFEHDVHTIVVSVAIRADREKVLYDRTGGFEAAGPDGPHERGDRLRAHLDVQHPQRPLPAGGASHRPLEELCRVGIYGLHDDGRTLVDDAGQNAGDEPQRPPERLLGLVVLREQAQHLHARRDERPEEVCGDAVAHVAQPQRGDVLHHALRLFVHLQSHRHDLVRDEVEARRRLLEIVLSGRGQCEELGVDLAADDGQRGVVQGGKEARERTLLAGRLPHQGHEHPRDILPQPRPRDLVQGPPILDQRAQGSQHDGLVLAQGDGARVL
mmetsp:Transcript_93649/g.269627  ORF Transcript_93649/g.269627 Transcript_93649/m.269627 type:complete len:411 (-) Transcript_93649:1187-2419(-)